MAYEPRMWTVYVSSSGEGGTKSYRRNWGEIVENVAGIDEYHWMAGNFLKYAGPLNWNDLPVDSHELIATGDIAFRQHASGHTDQPNWPYFLEFAGRHMSSM